MQPISLIWALLLLCPNKSENMMKKKAAGIDWESGVSDQTGPSSVNIQDAGVKTASRCLASILS